MSSFAYSDRELQDWIYPIRQLVFKNLKKNPERILKESPLITIEWINYQWIIQIMKYSSHFELH